MKLEEAIEDLKAEREQVVQAFTSLELLSERRGRELQLPPGAKIPISKLLRELKSKLVRLELELVGMLTQKDSELKAKREEVEEVVTSPKKPARGRGRKRGGLGQKDLKALRALEAAIKGTEPPLEGAAVPVRVPRPRPNLPPATAAAAVPRPELTLAVSDLKSEREQIEKVITSLEELGRGRGGKRGRPSGSNDPGSQSPPAPPAAARIASRLDRDISGKKPT